MRFRVARRSLAWSALSSALALSWVAAIPPEALAGCCNVVNPAASPVEGVRVCEMNEAGGRDAVLFEGALAPGESMHVCSETDWIVVDEPDGSPDGRSAPRGEECDGADVEL